MQKDTKTVFTCGGCTPHCQLDNLVARFHLQQGTQHYSALDKNKEPSGSRLITAPLVPAPLLYPAYTAAAVSTGSLSESPSYPITSDFDGAHLLVTGGVFAGNSTFTTVVQSYRADLDRWALGPSMRVARDDHGACAVDRVVYVVGGTCSDNWRSADMLDARTGRWLRVADLLADHPDSTSAVNLDGNVVALGGYGSVAMETFDTAAAKWRKLAPMQNTRYRQAVCNTGKFLFVIGALDTDCALRCDRYSLATDSWDQMANLPEHWCCGGAIATDSEVHLLGGGHWNEQNRWIWQRRSLVYSLTENAWSSRPALAPVFRCKYFAIASVPTALSTAIPSPLSPIIVNAV